MPFELIPRKAPKITMDPTKVYLRSRKLNITPKAKRAVKPGGGAGKYYGFAIGAAVLKQIGWDADTRLNILWGTGRDLNKVQITPDAQGQWQLRVHKSGCAFLTTSALPATCAYADFADKAVFFEMPQAGVAPKPKLLQIELPDGFHAKSAKAA